MSLSKDSILQDGEYILALESAGFTKVDFDADKQKINEKQKKVKALSDEIDLLSKNNKMLKLLSSLLVQIMLKRNASSATAELLFHF